MVRVKKNADIAEEVARLKAQSGKNLVLWGGVRIAQTFAQLGLIDEYWLLIQPKVLGSGQPLFIDIKDRINLKLASARASQHGRGRGGSLPASESIEGDDLMGKERHA